MNKPYNVDDILNEIKAKKARSARPGQTYARKTGRKSRPPQGRNFHRNRSPAR